MTATSAVILGLVQGIAEFLPISSSGHLSILQNLFGMETAEQGHFLFDVLLHLGTLVSVCLYYRRDIAAMFQVVLGIFSPRRGEAAEGDDAGRLIQTRRLVVMIIFSTLPLLLVIPVKKHVERLYSETGFIGLALILTGCMLFISDKMRRGEKTEKNMTVLDALIVGVCQAVAVIPGLSRSGVTITAGMSTGLDREFAVRYSFLISLPAVLAANLLSLADAFRAKLDPGLIPVYLLGMAVAGLAGYISIGLVGMITRRGRFGAFAFYCWIVGATTIVLSFMFG